MENENKPDKIFADGIIFSRPKEGAPEFVKGRLSFKVEEAVAFLEKHKKADGWVNCDLKKSQNGKLYLQLDTFVPKSQIAQGNAPKTDYPAEEIHPEDIPF